MKSLYDAARHLVWLTQFGLSVVIPPVVCIIGAVWLHRQLQLGGMDRRRGRSHRCAGGCQLSAQLAAGAGPAGKDSRAQGAAIGFL